MTQSSPADHRAVRHFVLVTESCDLLGDANLEALDEAGCTDASIGKRTVEFDREALTPSDAIQQVIRDVTSVSGLRVVDDRDSMDAVPSEPTQHALT